MITREPKYSIQEHARRGNELYEQGILPKIDQIADQGKIVAIDIESGDFAVAEDVLEASEALLVRRPDAQTWFVRVGHQGVHNFGPNALGNLE
ncbi:MAG: hypothetical protein O3B01_30690 [Planctomycetota bacterium]|nr:hypothetical protein [Planctomycetota bacterium]MDA1142951.1 hypothetical protein [Planctomycetota bacterium]